MDTKLKEGLGGCYYISGVPGTGKTATVMEVMRCLQVCHKFETSVILLLQESSDEYPDFNFYSMNGMRLTCPDQAYPSIFFVAKTKSSPI